MTQWIEKNTRNKITNERTLKKNTCHVSLGSHGVVNEGE